MRHVSWAGGWVAEAHGVDGWLWIADARRKRPGATRRRVERWARANGLAIAWQPPPDGAACAPPPDGPGVRGRAPGLRCRMCRARWGLGWAAEAATPDGWLWIADARKRPGTTRRRVERWARANGLAIAWEG